MSASGYTPIQLYYSTTAAAVPVNTNLASGELAINITDGKLYYKNNSNVVTLLAAAAAATGTVSSVAQSFTGGLISVAGSPITTSGTLALTVAGTSGGIPYFSSASTWATSAALAASALVIGGGAGAAPSTTTTGTGVVTALGVNTGTAGAFVVNGGALGTPSSGTVTNLTGTASININGTVGATTASSGAFTTLSASGTTTLSGNQIISVTDNTNAALRITQLGTGNALLVEDSTNPDSTPVAIDTSGNLLVGITTAQTINTLTPAFQQLGAGNYGSIWSGRYSANATGNGIYLSKSRSATVGTNTIVQSGDDLGTLFFFGADGTDLIQAASILAEVDGTPGTNDMPGRLVFSTTADGASTPTERMRIDSSGNVGIGTSSPTSGLQTAGSSSKSAFKTPNIAEVDTISATAATGTINYDVTTQSVLFYTSNASANWTVNFRGSSGTSLNTLMQTGESISATFLVTQGATAYYNSAVQVDGSSVTPKWQGGTAPTSGNASSIDSYTYVLIKTGSAAFTVLASITKFA